jgi:uncharacterized protein YlzI (FlbEa/FlbD family)
MIYLTKLNEDKTKFLVNHRKIINIEKSIGGTSNLYMDNGKVFTVAETEEEIYKIIEKYEVEIIKKAIQEAKKVQCDESKTRS